MSRSYKKTPCCHIAGKDNSWKKLFNRRLRRLAKFRDLPNGNSYKKANESWCISDYKQIGYTRKQFLRDHGNDFKNRQEAIDYYDNCYF